MGQLRIFLSHASADKPFADALVRALRGAGADVWYDEHSLGAGHLLDEIQRELAARPAFVLVLTKAAFTSAWVKREATWAFNLYNREPSRILMPVVAAPIEPGDFNAGWLFLEDFRRVEGPGNTPYPQAEAIERTLRLLALTPHGAAPASVTQQAAGIGDLLLRAKALHASGDYADAIRLFRQATQLDEASAAAWVGLGNACFDAGRYEASERALVRAVDLDPTSARAWTSRAAALLALKRYGEALAAGGRALDLDPSNARAQQNQASAFFYLHRYEDALTASERALELDAGQAGIWMTKGTALQRLGRLLEALAAFERALELDPHDPTSWASKAAVLSGLGREREAEEARLWGWRHQEYPDT